ncbi:MAG: single-stranded DNA-binding protein [Christensenellales bacterium]
MNKVFLVGNLTKDPELSTTTNGISVCRFSLAVSRRYVGASGERETDFINIVVWRGQAENCHKYLKKGSKCGIVGTLQTRSYDAQDGSKRYVTEVVADEVEFISTRNSDGSSKQEIVDDVENVTELKPIDDDSLPF